jgi:hypothetical protein
VGSPPRNLPSHLLVPSKLTLRFLKQTLRRNRYRDLNLSVWGFMECSHSRASRHCVSNLRSSPDRAPGQSNFLVECMHLRRRRSRLGIHSQSSSPSFAETSFRAKRVWRRSQHVMFLFAFDLFLVLRSKALIPHISFDFRPNATGDALRLAAWRSNKKAATSKNSSHCLISLQ